MQHGYDAILIVAFGGPEKRSDVIPFLENVLTGRDVPQQRTLAVAEHYYQFDGVSPHNAHVRDLIDALQSELDSHSIDLPVFWGNRNWHPLLPDTLRQMASDGVRRALAVVLSGYGSYSSCRQYLDNIEHARRCVGDTAPLVDKVRLFFNHPRFVAACADRLGEGLSRLPADRLGTAALLFTAHSIPQAMADGCRYASQLAETCRLTADEQHIAPERWKLVYQSRSGRPQDPWLGPDVCDYLPELAERGVRDVVVMPIGFLSDHMEVLFDLDVEARQLADDLELNLVRAGTVGLHPEFVSMLRELIEERLGLVDSPRAAGSYPPSPDTCPGHCCPPPMHRRPT